MIGRRLWCMLLTSVQCIAVLLPCGAQTMMPFMFDELDETIYVQKSVHDQVAWKWANDTLLQVNIYGSNDLMDWVSNLMMFSPVPIPGTSVFIHRGFADAAESILTKTTCTPVWYDPFCLVWGTISITDTVVGKAIRDADTVYLTGHSRGGALASVLALKVKADETYYGKTDLQVATHGEPRSVHVDTHSLDVLTQHIKKWRFVYKNDLIPSTPRSYQLPFGRFQHWGEVFQVVGNVSALRFEMRENPEFPTSATSITDHHVLWWPKTTMRKAYDDANLVTPFHSTCVDGKDFPR